MAHSGTGFFDSKGNYFRSPEEATISDLAAMLGRVGEGESLAPGLAHMMLEKRSEIDAIFADHDAMLRIATASKRDDDDGTVARLRPVS